MAEEGVAIKQHASQSGTDCKFQNGHPRPWSVMDLRDEAIILPCQARFYSLVCEVSPFVDRLIRDRMQQHSSLTRAFSRLNVAHSLVVGAPSRRSPIHHFTGSRCCGLNATRPYKDIPQALMMLKGNIQPIDKDILQRGLQGNALAFSKRVSR